MTIPLTHPAAPPSDDQSEILHAFRVVHDLEMEQQVIGALLTNNEAMRHANPDLREHHFAAEIHQQVFGFIREGWAAGKVVTPVTLKHQFANNSLVIEDRYLARLASSSTNLVNLAAYSDKLIEFSHRRMLQRAAIDVARMCGNTADTTPADLCVKLTGAIDSVRMDTTDKAMLTSREVGLKVIESIRKPPEHISTGLPRFDAAIGGGMRRGQAYAIAGRYGHGKTMFANTISTTLDMLGHKHMFIAAEMDDEEIYCRSLARRMNCTYERFYMPPDLYPEGFISELGHIVSNDKGNVIYTHDPFLTFDRLKQYVATAVAKHQINGFVLDYWQLVRGGRPNQKTEHLDEVAQWVAAACKEYNIWAIMLSQLNRDGDTRGGDGILNAFPFAFYIEREDDSQDYLWLRCKKARHVKMGHVGKPHEPAYRIVENGPYVEELIAGYVPEDFTPPPEFVNTFKPRNKRVKATPKDITAPSTAQDDLLAET
jgi:replicative DNA helicase